MTDPAVPSLTVKVTTPFASETPLGAEIVELPPPAVKETVLPLTGLLFASFKVTVMVEVVESSAGTEMGLAATADVLALTGPGSTVKLLLVPIGFGLPAPVAVMVKFPVLVIVTLWVRTPLVNALLVNVPPDSVPVELMLTLLPPPLKLVTVLLNAS